MGMFTGIVQDGCAVPIQDYKSLCVAVMICTTVVNTQTDKQTDRFQLSGEPAEL